MTDVVHITRVGSIALVEIDNPPVNAAGAAVRQALWAAIPELDSDPGVQVIALYGAGRTFTAGADIREFGKPPIPPMLPDLCQRLEDCQTPLISVLHGTALGGGLEMAVATHARIGLPGLRVGLPEVALGIIPGAGGTQRAPRLVGLEAGLEMITSGRHVPAEEALQLGLIDRLDSTSATPRDAARTAAQAVLEGALVTRRTGDIDIPIPADVIARWSAEMARKYPLLPNRKAAVEAVAACAQPIRDGVREERRVFNVCLDSPERAGLVHAFFAERATSRIPEAGSPPRPVGSVGVIGGGTMGAGIATAFLLAGLPVSLSEQDPASAAAARDRIAGHLEGAVKRGKMTAETRDVALATHLQVDTKLDVHAQADLVIEAAWEDLETKKSIFAALDGVAKPGAILATNTSYLDVDSIAAATTRPADVLGLHFFSPAHVMRLLEVVVGAQTAADVTATAFALAKTLRKVPVRARICDGFIGNRILNRTRMAADHLLLMGASPAQVDGALERWGFALGPFATLDLAGLDIGWAARKRRAPTRDPRERYLRLADRICEAGHFGRKTGRGYYRYDGGARQENPEMLAWLQEERAEQGISPRALSDQDIVDYYLTAMICEAAALLGDGIALRAVDVDAVLLFGYGFPRQRGGPLLQADMLGPQTVLDRIEAYAKADDHFWQVPPLLAQLAASDGRFAKLPDSDTPRPFHPTGDA